MHRASLQAEPDPQPLIPGAPNFRRLTGRSIYGVAQPTLAALAQVLDVVGRECLWVNLREEAVLYLAGESCCLRERSQPLMNPVQPGIPAGELEDFEGRLRQEVESRGTVSIYEEGEDHVLVERKSYVRGQVRTIQQVFAPVNYHRVPVSDEQSPEVKDFQELYDLLRGERRPRVFNCHAGRGRTTTAMIVADLIEQGPLASAASVREQRSPAQESLWKAVAVFPQSQEAADQAIERSSRLQHLKEAILSQEPVQQGYSPSPEAALALRARDYLRRYFALVTFAEFVGHEGGNFAAWLAERPEKRKALRRLERALGLWSEI